MPFDDTRERVQHHLEPLAGRDQAEGREQEAGLHRLEAAGVRGEVPRRAPAVELGRAAASCGGAPCGTTADLGRVAAPRCSSSRRADSVMTITRSASSQSAVKTRAGPASERRARCEASPPAVARAPPRTRGRTRRLVHRRSRTRVARSTTSTSVRARAARGAHVVAARSLEDRLHDLGPLRRRRMVDDHERRNVVDVIDGEQRLADVVRERADPARARRVGREDRGPHALTGPRSYLPRACFFPASPSPSHSRVGSPCLLRRPPLAFAACASPSLALP